MSVVKVIEVLAESDKGWEDATQQALKEASKTIHDIENIYIKDFKAIVKDGKISKYRINAKVSFVLSNKN